MIQCAQAKNCRGQLLCLFMGQLLHRNRVCCKNVWTLADRVRVAESAVIKIIAKLPSSIWSTVPPRATKFSQMTSQDYTMNTHGRLHPAVEWVEPQEPFSHPQYLQCIFWLLNGFNKIWCDDWPVTTPSWYVSWPYLHPSKGLGLRVSSRGYAIY